MSEEGTEDRVYRWTVRTLYVVGFALNAWLLWDQAKGTPEVALLKERGRRAWQILTYPARERAIFRRQANAVVYEAITIVEEGTE